MELQAYITETSGVLPECGICHDVGTVGVEWCSQCPELMHVACRKRLFQGREEGKCPGCRADWAVGRDNKSRRRIIEPVVVDEEDEEMDKSEVIVEDEESKAETQDEEEEEEEEEIIATSVGKKRRR
jgi:hypothetical protein